MVARLIERRGIGQREFGQRLQRVVLGAGQLAEEDQPVAEAVAGGESSETVGTVGEEAGLDRQ